MATIGISERPLDPRTVNGLSRGQRQQSESGYVSDDPCVPESGTAHLTLLWPSTGITCRSEGQTLGPFPSGFFRDLQENAGSRETNDCICRERYKIILQHKNTDKESLSFVQGIPFLVKYT